VRRQTERGTDFDEQLSLNPAHVRMGRLNNKGAVLRDHARESIDNTLGVVEKAWIRDGKGYALIRLSKREDVAGIVGDIIDGIINQVSITYDVFRFEDVTKQGDQVRTLRAVDWEPKEISFICVGADAGAQQRSATDNVHRYEIVRRTNNAGAGNRTMAKVTTKKNGKRSLKRSAQRPKPTPKKPAKRQEPNPDDDVDEIEVDELARGAEDDDEPELEGDVEGEDAEDGEEGEGQRGAEDDDEPDLEDDDDVETEDDDAPASTGSRSDRGEPRKLSRVEMKNALEKERRRSAGILDAARKAKVSRRFAENLVRKGVDLGRARGLIIDEHARTTAGPAIGGGQRVEIVRTESDTNRMAIADALLFRYDMGRYPLKPDSPGREYVGLTLREVARLSLAKQRIKTNGMDIMRMAGIAIGYERSAGMAGVTDFAATLENIATKTLRRAYDQAPQTFMSFCRSGTLPDFKLASRVNFGSAPQLLKVNPSGEIEIGKVTDSAEKYQLSTYGSRFVINRQAIVNDDMQAFTRLPEMYGSQARNMESTVVYSILTTNAAMADGVALFHATHGNLVTPALSVTGLGTGRAKMRQQTGQAGELLNIAPKTLVVPTALEMTAQQVTLPITPQQAGNVNPFVNALSPVAEPRLDASSLVYWYLMASIDQIDMIEIAWLEGMQGPRIETRIGFEVEGVEIKAVEDFGAKAIDWRGMLKSDAST
jgi:hypothetical protein